MKLKASITAAFINLNKETVGIPKLIRWLKPMAISVNKFNLLYLMIFSCNFGDSPFYGRNSLTISFHHC